MTSYEFLLLLHIVAVIVWIGAGATMDLLFYRAARMRDPLQLKTVGEAQEWLVPRLFIPVSLSVLVTGVAVAWDGGWSFGELWIAVGLVGFAVAFLSGFLYLRPQGEKMKEIAATFGPASPEAQRQGQRLMVVARVQLLLLFLIVANMVLKPTTDEPWTLVVLAAILVAAMAAGLAVLRRPLGVPGEPVAR